MEKRKCCCGNAAEEAIPEGCLVPSGEELQDIHEGEASITCCGSRTKHRDDREMRDLIHRLNRIEGQIRGIKSMVEEDRYCVDILTQVSAVRSALNSFNRVLLNQHIRTCVVDRIEEGDPEVVDELCDVIQKMIR